MSQRFCPARGQPAIDPNPTLGEFVHEAASEFLHWDGKLAATFRLLFTKPGELTREGVLGNARRRGDQTAASLRQTIPNVMFVLVPIFAGLVALRV